jgi:hypothetical protein
MSLFENLSKKELKELLIKCWMTHDGAWFYNCSKELGINAANTLNKAAIKSLSIIEIQRIKKAMGFKAKEIQNFGQLKQIINNAFSVLKGDFMNFSYSFPQQNQLHWVMKRCFANEGMKRIGIIDDYECGVLYRVCCWLDFLGVNYKIEPTIKKCLLLTQDSCSGMITFYF